jgi:sortase (surface protein transpeptidase)
VTGRPDGTLPGGRRQLAALPGVAVLLGALVVGGVMLFLAAGAANRGGAQQAVDTRFLVPFLADPSAQFVWRRSPAPPAAPKPDRRPSAPVSIAIPAIGVDARVVRLGLNPDGTLEVPTDNDATGWWTGGPRPGESGGAVIAGHVDSRSGPAVFNRLSSLRRGDAVDVRGRDGRTVHFSVQRLAQYPKDRFPAQRVYRRGGPAGLRLITCGGAFDAATGHYLDNTVVYARPAAKT